MPAVFDRTVAPEPSTEPTESGAELRLALVCYGGVSLAIYMHGVTKELHKLVRASRRFDDLGKDADINEAFPDSQLGTDSERTYFEVLRELAKNGRRLSVSIDIIAGTSAGGINGVCLGKVIARNGSQEKLKKLWIEEGDLKKLLRAPAIGGWRTQALLAALPIAAEPKAGRSPLRGERMSQLLFDAIKDMDTQQSELRSLIRPGGTLDLFVTTTDLHGFEVLVPTGAGGASQRDRNYGQVLQFQAHYGGTALDADSTGALAFSARATSCFPGAFPPVSLASFAAELNARPTLNPLTKIRRRLFGRRQPLALPDRTVVASIADYFAHRYEESGARAEDAWFVDGGVLDNAPFDLAVDAIGKKTAQTEVFRRLLYVQPDPGRPLQAAAAHSGRSREAPPAGPPGWLPALWQGVATVKGSHSVLGELFTIRDMNTRIREVSAIADSQMQQVNTAVTAAWAKVRDGAEASGAQTPWGASRDQVQALSDTMHEEAKQQVGLAYRGYCLLKVEEAGRRLADEVATHFVYPPDSSRSSFVRSAVSAWARSREDWMDLDSAALMEFFRPIDLPYRERRLLFILAGVNDLYPQARPEGASGVTRSSLNSLKREAWRLLEQVRDTPALVVKDTPLALTEFLNQETLDAETLLADPQVFAGQHRDSFEALFQHYRRQTEAALGDGSRPLWEAYERETSSWGLDAADERKALLSRYLGFPLWDALIFPTIALSRLPQFTPIGVSQFSPLTAGAIPAPPPSSDFPNGASSPGKLRGVSLHHFGGFTQAAWRENDYLWGRLDAAELILRMLRHDIRSAGSEITPSSPQQAIELAGRHHLSAVLDAIMHSEQELRRIPATTAYIRQKIDEMGGS